MVTRNPAPNPLADLCNGSESHFSERLDASMQNLQIHFATPYFDNLLGGCVNGNGNDLVPVRFGLKHSRTGNTTLYVVVNQHEISTDKLTELKEDRGHSDPSPDLTESDNPLISIKYSISEILGLVNSEDLLRYVPDNFLT